MQIFRRTPSLLTARSAAIGRATLPAALALLWCLAAGPARAQPVDKPEDRGWWHSGYLVDYGLIALGATGYLARNLEPTTSALFGPRYDPDNPAAILDPKYSDRVGRTHLQEDEGETVSTGAATALVGAGGLYLLAEQGLGLLGDDPDRARMMHDTLVGYLETVALSTGLNAFLKNMVGRLRPDFQDRARRYHCDRGELDASLCGGVAGPLATDSAENDKIWLDGRRSFMSGHSISAMNFTTYLSLSIGGQYVWGRGASDLSRSVGLAAQAVLLSGGVFVAASRFDDGRHHFGDVMTGSMFGVAVANFSYWRRFGLDGRPRPRAAAGATTVSLDPGPGDAGLALTVRYL